MKTLACFIIFGTLLSACGKKASETKPAVDQNKSASVLRTSGTTPNEIVAEAVQAGDEGALAYALDRGANSDLMLANGSSLLTSAISNNFPGLVAALLDAGADARKLDRNGKDPVLLAAQLHRPQIVRQLIERRADVNTRDAQGRSLLMLAISQGDTEAAEWLIYEGADPNAVDHEGQTAAKIAHDQGLDRVVRMIDLRLNLDRGVSSDEVLKQILAQTDVEALRLALQRSPSILRVAMPTSPLYQAVQGVELNRISEMVQLILDQDIPADGQATDPRSPLAEASALGLTDVIEILVKRGASLETKDAIGLTPLMHAVRENQPLSVLKLLELRALTTYTYIMNDRSTRISACGFARDIGATSSTDRERAQQIRSALRCNGRRFSSF